MSGYHLKFADVGRSEGKSVVAKAAYNARTQLDNERFAEKTANYGRKGQDEVLFSGIFIDPKRQAPETFQDRNRLWNTAAAAETRKDSREGQEIIAALPYQLTDQQREMIVKDFARELARSTARAIDVNIHRPPANGDERNYHVHMLMTVRQVGPEGFSEKRAAEIDIAKVREKWAERTAKELRKAGHEIEADRWAVGHLGQEEQRQDALRRGDLEHAQAKEKEAGKHLGPEVTAMERAGIETDRGNIERQKFAAAQEVLKLKAELAVIDREISREVSAFVEHQERETRGGARVEEGREAPLKPKERELGWTDGQIRMAFSLTKDAQSFANAIEDRGLIVARVTPSDIEKDSARLRQEWEERQRNPETWMQHQGGYEALSGTLKATARRSFESWQKGQEQRKQEQPTRAQTQNDFTLGEYVNYVQGKQQEAPLPSTLGRATGGLVIVTARGDVHRLTPQNTGMEKNELKAYLAQIDQAPLLSVQDSRRVMGDVYQQARTEKIIARNERHWPTAPPKDYAVKTSPAYHFQDAARATAEATAANVPPPNLRGTAAEIWRAYNVRSVEQQWPEKQKDGSQIKRTRSIDVKAGRDPHQFAQALEAKGITLARVTAEEAERSYKASSNAKGVGHYTPLFREGEFVAVDKRGQAYQLSQRNTGAKPWEVQEFLNKVEWKNLQSIEATKARAHTIRQEMPEKTQGTAAQIWEAHHNAKDATQFQKNLTNYAKVIGKQGLALAVVSEGDQALAPNVARGSFVVVNQKGYVFELNQKTTGRSIEGAQEFMRASLTPSKFASVTAVRAAQITKMQQIRATEAKARNDRAIKWGKNSGRVQVGKTGNAAATLNAAPSKALSGVMRGLGGLLGGLFSALVPDAPKTPEQIETLVAKAEKREIDWSKFVYDTDHERAIASQQEQARYRQQEAENWKKDRDREGRDR